MRNNQATIGNVLLAALAYELDNVFYVKNGKRKNNVSRVNRYNGARERMPAGEDHIRPELADTTPGSAARIEALAAFYAVNEEESAFL